MSYSFIISCWNLVLVRYYSRDDTEDCVKYISGTILDDRPIRVDFDWGFQEGRQWGRGRSGGQVIQIKFSSPSWSTVRTNWFFLPGEGWISDWLWSRYPFNLLFRTIILSTSYIFGFMLAFTYFSYKTVIILCKDFVCFEFWENYCVFWVEH